jgi:hypothetical protein
MIFLFSSSSGTCPSGERYGVGDNNDDCKSLACEGGIHHSECNRHVSQEWASIRVKCGKPTTEEKAKKSKKYFFPDKVKTGGAAGATGAWGGFCTCPNGEVYGVGDNNNGCGSLACEGGIRYSACYKRKSPKWGSKRVVCGQQTGKEEAENAAEENEEVDEDIMPNIAKSMEKGASDSEATADDTERDAKVQSAEPDYGEADREQGKANGAGKDGSPDVGSLDFLIEKSSSTNENTAFATMKMKHVRACKNNARVQATLHTTLAHLKSLPAKIPIEELNYQRYRDGHHTTFIEEEGEPEEEDSEGENAGPYRDETNGTDTTSGPWEYRIKELERTVALQREEIASIRSSQREEIASIHGILARAFGTSSRPDKRSAGADFIEVDSQKKTTVSRDLIKNYLSKTRRSKTRRRRTAKETRRLVIRRQSQKTRLWGCGVDIPCHLNHVWDKIKEKIVNPVWNFIKDNVVTPITNLFKPIIDWIKDIWAKIMDAFKSLSKVWDFVKKVIQWFKDIPKMIQNMLVKVVRKVEKVLDKIIQIGSEFVSNAKDKAVDACAWTTKSILKAICKYPMMAMFMTFFKLQDLIGDGIDLIMQKIKGMVDKKINYDMDVGSKEATKLACSMARLLFLPVIPANLSWYMSCLLIQRMMFVAVSLLDLVLHGITVGSAQLGFLAPGISFKTKAAAGEACKWYIDVSRIWPTHALVVVTCHAFVRLVWGLVSLLSRMFSFLNAKLIQGFLGVTNLGIHDFFHETETCNVRPGNDISV